MEKCKAVMPVYSNLIQSVREWYGTEAFIPLHMPRFKGNEKKNLIDTIDSTFVSSVGAYVNQAEEKLAEITQTSKAVAVVNGTAALQVTLRIAGVRSGDEVLTQALTFVATANAISYNGADPIFIDVDRDTMGLSPVALQTFLENNAEIKGQIAFNKITGKRITACMPMHTFGFMCRIDEIVNICNEWNIPVIEDAAEALGSCYKRASSGCFGLAGCFSFNGNKIITSGGGGMIVSKDTVFAERAKYLTTTAKVPHQWDFFHDETGFNFRMPNVNAALLTAQVEQLEQFIADKKALYEHYKSELPKAGLKLKEIPADTQWNYWLISVETENREQRDELLKYTNDAGLMTRPIWQLMYRLPMFRECIRDNQENAEYLEERIVNIPSSAR